MKRDDTIEIYVDGSCSPNPGNSGIGVVIIEGDNVTEYSKNIGINTNNVAELEAIKYAIELTKDSEKIKIIFSDSQYCLGVLSQGWNANKNVELIRTIKKMLDSKFLFAKVKSHSTNKYNKMADRLAYYEVNRSNDEKENLDDK